LTDTGYCAAIQYCKYTINITERHSRTFTTNSLYSIYYCTAVTRFCHQDMISRSLKLHRYVRPILHVGHTQIVNVHLFVSTYIQIFSADVLWC